MVQAVVRPAIVLGLKLNPIKLYRYERLEEISSDLLMVIGKPPRVFVCDLLIHDEVR